MSADSGVVINQIFYKFREEDLFKKKIKKKIIKERIKRRTTNHQELGAE